MRAHTPFLLLALVLTALLSLACRSLEPTVEMGDEAEITHDGLHRVRHARAAQRVWVKPDLDLSSYTKLLPVDAGFHYKRTPRRARGEFALDDRQMDFVRQELRKAFEAELTQRGDWTFVSERGPDVLVLRGAIIDFVVTGPADDVGRNRTYSASVGAATLVIEIFDSQSLEILVRIADRRAIEHDSSSWRNDPMTNRAAARRTFRHWARQLADGLETARTMPLPLEPVDD